MKYIFDALIVLLLAFIFGILICIIRALIIKNKKQRLLFLLNNDRNEKYAEELLSLIKIKPTEEQGFHQKLQELFPLIHQHFTFENIDGNFYYSYEHKSSLPYYLLVAHFNKEKYSPDAYITDDKIYGYGTFDTKAYLYSIFQATEEILQKKNKLELNLVLVVIIDDENKHSEQIVNWLLKKGKFFNLILEEGTGIIDPTSFGLQSNQALIGIGVTGEMEVIYRVSKSRGVKPLELFLEEIKSKKLFKTEIDRNVRKVLNAFARDMKFSKRIIYLMPRIFKRKIKNELNNEIIEIGNLLKTHQQIMPIDDDENYYYVRVIYNLASHDTPAEIIRIMIPYIEKYQIDYQVKKIIEPSKITSTASKGYRHVKKTIYNVFKSVYITPYIITNISNRRYFTRVSDCVIRFSPLYYPHQAIKDAYNGKEYLQKKSLSYSVDFFKKIIDCEE